MAEKKFLGFKQVTLAEFNSKTESERIGYMWLVRDGIHEDDKNKADVGEIWLGNRKYAELNQDTQEIAKLEALIAAMGDMVSGSTGEWVGWNDEHEIIGNKENLSEVIEALEEWILGSVYAIDELSAGTISEVERLDERIDKLTGPFIFKGSAKKLSEDETTLTLEDDTELVASSANTGFVYVIGTKEYASNGEKWVELGDESALAEEIERAMAAEEALSGAILAEEERAMDAEESLSGAIDTVREDLEKEVLRATEAEGKLDTRVGVNENDIKEIFNILMITGDDVEGGSDEELAEASKAEIEKVADNGGYLRISADTKISKTLQ